MRDFLIITTSGNRYSYPIPVEDTNSSAGIVRQIFARPVLVVESAMGYDVFLNTATIETIQEGDE